MVGIEGVIGSGDFRFLDSKVWHLVSGVVGAGGDFKFLNSKVWHLVGGVVGAGGRFQISRF